MVTILDTKRWGMNVDASFAWFSMHVLIVFTVVGQKLQSHRSIDTLE